MICLCNCLKFQLTYKTATKDKAQTWCPELTEKEGHLEEQNKRLQHQLLWVERQKAANVIAGKENGRKLLEIKTAKFMPEQCLQGELWERQTYEGH